MPRNMGTADRVIRTILALVAGWLYFTGRIGGTLGIILVVVAAVFLLTSFVGSCPAYLPFGLSTRKPAPPGSQTPKL